MLRNTNVPFKTQKNYIYSTIGKQLEKKDCGNAIKNCTEILPYEKNNEAKKLIKRAVCEAYYYSNDYPKLIELCSEMENEFADDITIIKFVNEYKKAIKAI